MLRTIPGRNSSHIPFSSYTERGDYSKKDHVELWFLCIALLLVARKASLVRLIVAELWSGQSTRIWTRPATSFPYIFDGRIKGGILVYKKPVISNN